MIKYKFQGESSPRDITAIHYREHNEATPSAPVRVITAVYRKVNGSIRLLWEIINSCFGSGFWVNAKPWSNKDGWKNKP